MDGDRIARDIERETRRRIRREMRAAERAEQSPLRGAMFGLIVITIGLALLLNNLGIIPFRNIWDFAPLVLVVIGTVRLLDANGKTPALVGGALFIVGGGLWFAHNMGWFYIDGRIVAPAVLIGLGVLFLVRALDRQRFYTVGTGQPFAPVDAAADPTSPGPAPDGEAPFDASAIGSVLHEWVLFGGLKRRVTSQQFRGGDLFAMFGGIDLDLRGAAMAGSQIVIEANAIFGGIDLKVPATWHVIVRGQGIFGGYEDKTLPATVPTAQTQQLVISGMAMFGGVVVKN